MPWLQVSCIGVRDSLSGYDLARSGDAMLWLIPVSMLAIIISLAAGPVWRATPMLVALIVIVAGGATAYLMYREQSDKAIGASVFEARWTVQFWICLAAAAVLSLSGIWLYRKRVVPP